MPSSGARTSHPRSQRTLFSFHFKWRNRSSSLPLIPYSVLCLSRLFLNVSPYSWQQKEFEKQFARRPWIMLTMWPVSSLKYSSRPFFVAFSRLCTIVISCDPIIYTLLSGDTTRCDFQSTVSLGRERDPQTQASSSLDNKVTRRGEEVPVRSQAFLFSVLNSLLYSNKTDAAAEARGDLTWWL